VSGAPAPERWFDLRRHSGLAGVMDEAVQRCRSNRFLTRTDRGRVVDDWTYRDFAQASGALAAALAADGVGPGTRVALLMANGPAWLASAAAVWRVGATLVPLDPKLDPEGQVELLAAAKGELLLADGPAWRRLKDRELPPAIVSEPLPNGLGPARAWDDVLAGAGAAPPVAARERDDPATIVFSSGTAGRAKGCVLTHGNYLSQMEVLGNLYPMREDDAYLSILPTHHAIDMMCGFLVPLLCGARVVHLKTLRPEFLLEALKEQEISHMAAVPALLEALANRLRERIDAVDGVAAAGLRGMRKLNRLLTRRAPSHAVSRALLAPVHGALGGKLRRIFAGGAFVPPATASFLYDLGLPVAIGYGLTEACAVVAVNDLAPFRADTVGAPVPGTEVKLEPRDGRGRGEVCVRGPQVFSGYLDDPQATEAALRGGWLRTGDLGEIDATGHLRLVGRLKDVIVTPGGKNVHPEDVEGRFHGVAAEELAVLAAPAVWGAAPGEDEALLLAVRPKGEAGALRDDLAARNRRLPAHQRVAGVLWVKDPFPRTTSLKLKRRDLALALAGRDRGELERLG
jgi:long-chain acyl-CoA synthetase